MALADRSPNRPLERWVGVIVLSLLALAVVNMGLRSRDRARLDAQIRAMASAADAWQERESVEHRAFAQAYLAAHGDKYRWAFEGMTPVEGDK